ncbi:MAG: YibE/F family protein [Candidatus Levybacteria bacterium]|nr:YibE/F family protein [Candidatus Levybacteria bacterium]
MSSKARSRSAGQKLFIFLFVLHVVLVLFPSSSFAQEGLEIVGQQSSAPQESFHKGTVVKIEKEGMKKIGNDDNFYQTVQLQLDNNKTILAEYGGQTKIPENQKLRIGNEVVVLSAKLPNQPIKYHIVDRYRLTPLPFLIIGFFVLVIAFAGRKGLGSIAGMIISLGVLLFFIVPQILAGHDALLVTIIGALFIMITTIYLSHGFSRQTTVAIIATFFSLLITGILAIYFVNLLSLQGLGSEENMALQFGADFINLQGILLGGIIIASLGVLDDTTTTQSATIFELAKTNTKLTFGQLVEKGLSIGREHIAALVNTLVLAYAGVSLSLFIFFVLNPQNQPYWVLLNSESIVEEVVRTIAGSIGLILAVPITTILAAWMVKKFSI